VKDIVEVQASLRNITHAIEDNVPPSPPRFGGIKINATRADLYEFEERGDSRSPDRLTDLRDVNSLFRDLDASVTARGTEALAWYHPFHQSAAEWGIYIPMTSVHYGAERWFNQRIGRRRRYLLALEVLLNHEVIHHACEYAVAQLELFLRAACWAPARERLTNAKLQWFNDEEALANANSIRQLAATEPGTIVDRVERSLLQCPQGYRDFPLALSDEGFQDHILEVLRHNVGITAIDLGTWYLDPAFDALVVFPELVDARASCPLYLFDDSGQYALPPLSLRQITNFPGIVETNKFMNMLRKLDHRRQEEWRQMRTELTHRVPPYPKFKKLKGRLSGFWGLYLSDGFRVHVRPTPTGVWEAVEIGSHNAMGHG